MLRRVDIFAQNLSCRDMPFVTSEVSIMRNVSIADAWRLISAENAIRNVGSKVILDLDKRHRGG